MVGQDSSIVTRPMARLRKRFLSISVSEARFDKRGFRKGEPTASQQKLERAAETFIHGYNAGIEHLSCEAIVSALSGIEPHLQGFAYEGAGMAMAMLDCLTPWNRSRLRSLLDGPGNAHIYMVHVGAGWAIARLRRRVDRMLSKLDPLLGWLVVDGYGFHEGFFRPGRFIERCEQPRSLQGYQRRVFDQGLGRCLWFAKGADVDRVRAAVNVFAPSRRGDLYSGVGLACAYAGGVDRTAIESIRSGAGSLAAQLAQGAAFAAKARHRAGNPTVHTELACEILCGTSAQEAADLTDLAQDNLSDDESEVEFEVWRRRIQEHYAAKLIAA